MPAIEMFTIEALYQDRREWFGVEKQSFQSVLSDREKVEEGTLRWR
jgi:hypothetical protein